MLQRIWSVGPFWPNWGLAEWPVGQNRPRIEAIKPKRAKHLAETGIYPPKFGQKLSKIWSKKLLKI